MERNVSTLTAQEWPTNGHMIADVAKLGYLDGDCLDVTYGLGVFWSRWRPESLVACDLNAAKSPIGYSVDFTNLPRDFQGQFDAVVIDPPYKLNGQPTRASDERYGVEEYTPWRDRITLMREGMVECYRTLRPKGYLLVKVMDQVVSGKKRWLTDDATEQAVRFMAMEKVDRFDMLTKPRPQPEGRRQLHSLQNYSTLLVFQK